MTISSKINKGLSKSYFLPSLPFPGLYPGSFVEIRFCSKDWVCLTKGQNLFTLGGIPRRPCNIHIPASILGSDSLATLTWYPHAFDPFVGPRPRKSSELSGCWKMHRYYIYNKYFVHKLTLTTRFLYQKSFINIKIVNKINSMHWYNYKKVIGSQRKTSK